MEEFAAYHWPLAWGASAIALFAVISWLAWPWVVPRRPWGRRLSGFPRAVLGSPMLILAGCSISQSRTGWFTCGVG